MNKSLLREFSRHTATKKLPGFPSRAVLFNEDGSSSPAHFLNILEIYCTCILKVAMLSPLARSWIK